MKCPQCQHENPTNAKFCMECGEKLEAVCPQCGAKLPPEARFCMECGTKLTDEVKAASDERLARLQRFMPKGLVDKILSTKGQIEGERKIVTVLFADIQGSSGITRKFDPEVVSAIISDYFRILGEVVYKYQGSIDRLMGDGMMAIFGAPVVHENDPQRAIFAALEMQEELQKKAGISIRMRVGINTGTVVVDNIGSDLRMEYTAMGDMKTHIHEHCIIVDGGIDEYSQIVNVREIPMALLRQMKSGIVCGFRSCVPDAVRRWSCFL